MKKTFFFFLATTLLSSSSWAVGAYSEGDVLNVFALSGIRMRESPLGAILATLPNGAQVRMLEYQPSDRLDTVGNISGHWAKAVWQGKEGYVFDGFLSILPVPDASIKSIETYCGRYFEKLGSIELEQSVVFSEGLTFYRFPWHGGYWIVELHGSASESEGHGQSEKMTIRNAGEAISVEEMYLLMCAIFRDKIAEGQRMIREGKVKSAYLNAVETAANKDFFLFVRNAKAGSYARFNGVWEELEYSQNCQGSSVGWAYGD